MNRIEFVRERDGESALSDYCRLMRGAYRAAVLKGRKRADGSKGPITKTHPFRRKWIEGYLEFRWP